MKRIFLTLSLAASGLLIAALVLGLNIEDSRSRDPIKQSEVGVHMLTGLSALCFSCMVHAIVFTYFLGTGRWMEETRNAYGLADDWRLESHRLKWKTMVQIFFVFLLSITTGALGAVADPASPVDYSSFLGMSPATTHYFSAATTLLVNLLVFSNEFLAISRNSRLVEDVMRQVRRIRNERGLSV